MSREFEARAVNPKTGELRDYLAMTMPKPPFEMDREYPFDEKDEFIAEMKARYEFADKIIKGIR